MRSDISGCTLRDFVVLFSRVAKNDDRPAPKRRASQPKRSAGRSRRIVHWVLLFVASVIVVDALVGDRGLVAMLRARQEYDELSASIARQRTENARLRDMARRLREDPSTIEEIARRELGLIRPGERVFIVKDAPRKN
jgi:cell division protein FtsB